MGPLQSIGLLVQSARVTRGLTQERAAHAAGVSRKHWSALERGENVSVVFLRKVAASLGLSFAIAGDGESSTSSGGGVDLVGLFQIADDFAAVVERLRTFVFEAALPTSFRGNDAAAIEQFVKQRQNLSADEEARIGRALRLASELENVKPKPKNAPAARERSRRKRQG